MPEKTVEEILLEQIALHTKRAGMPLPEKDKLEIKIKPDGSFELRKKIP